MTWSTPMTAVAGNVFTAAQFNQYVRDNLNETAPAKATVAGQWFISTGGSAIAARTISSASVATSESTFSVSFTDLTTVGPAVTVSTGTSALIALSCAMINTSTTAFSLMGIAVSGATTLAAADSQSMGLVPSPNGARPSGFFLLTGLTAGTNTFTAKYRLSANFTSGSFSDRRLTVMPL